MEHLQAHRAGAPAPGGSILDIGSGQFALLAKELLRLQPHVADITDAYQRDLEALGVGFVQANLAAGGIPGDRRYDLIILAEVLEHVPRPPVTVLTDLFDRLERRGHLVLTTPNVFRLRNLLRMLRGKDMLDPFNVTTPEAPLGHFVEYSLNHLKDYVLRAGFVIEHAGIEQLSMGGATVAALHGPPALAWPVDDGAQASRQPRGGRQAALRSSVDLASPLSRQPFG
ncbi:MAG: class I SAM-dependent methyltransferase [Myxococcales bacterium]|nr:class I SAM-dependent methyltransferase [Myxococcales bacterium]